MQTYMMIGLLSLCSLQDLRRKKLLVRTPVLFAVAGVILHIFVQEITGVQMLCGMCVGGALALLAVLTREKIGMGDALLFAATGVYLGGARNFLLLFLSVIIASVCGIYLLIVKKKERNYEMVFVPFVLIAYLCMLLGEGVIS